jgi:hypothetical protein
MDRYYISNDGLRDGGVGRAMGNAEEVLFFVQNACAPSKMPSAQQSCIANPNISAAVSSQNANQDSTSVMVLPRCRWEEVCDRHQKLPHRNGAPSNSAIEPAETTTG